MPRKDNVVELARVRNPQPARKVPARRTKRSASTEEIIEMVRNFERVRKSDVRRSLIDLVAQLAN